MATDPAGLVFVGADVVEDIELSPSPVFEYHPVFVRGDTNDDGKIDISDPVKVFERLFLAPTNIRCLDAGDADDDGILNITDGIYVLQFLFLGGPAPLKPYPAPGADPSEDALACEGCYPARGP